MTLTSARPAIDAVPGRTSVGLVGASTVMAQRSIRSALRSGDVVLAVLGPVAFFVCFHTPLQNRFEAAGVDYAQYLAPVINSLSMNYVPIMTNPASGVTAFPDQLVYTDPSLADRVRSQTPAQPQPAPVSVPSGLAGLAIPGGVR